MNYKSPESRTIYENRKGIKKFCQNTFSARNIEKEMVFEPIKISKNRMNLFKKINGDSKFKAVNDPFKAEIHCDVNKADILSNVLCAEILSNEILIFRNNQYERDDENKLHVIALHKDLIGEKKLINNYNEGKNQQTENISINPYNPPKRYMKVIDNFQIYFLSKETKINPENKYFTDDNIIVYEFQNILQSKHDPNVKIDGLYIKNITKTKQEFDLENAEYKKQKMKEALSKLLTQHINTTEIEAPRIESQVINDYINLETKINDNFESHKNNLIGDSTNAHESSTQKCSPKIDDFLTDDHTKNQHENMPQHRLQDEKVNYNISHQKEIQTKSKHKVVENSLNSQDFIKNLDELKKNKKIKSTKKSKELGVDNLRDKNLLTKDTEIFVFGNINTQKKLKNKKNIEVDNIDVDALPGNTFLYNNAENLVSNDINSQKKLKNKKKRDFDFDILHDKKRKIKDTENLASHDLHVHDKQKNQKIKTRKSKDTDFIDEGFIDKNFKKMKKLEEKYDLESELLEEKPAKKSKKSKNDQQLYSDTNITNQKIIEKDIKNTVLINQNVTNSEIESQEILTPKKPKKYKKQKKKISSESDSFSDEKFDTQEIYGNEIQNKVYRPIKKYERVHRKNKKTPRSKEKSLYYSTRSKKTVKNAKTKKFVFFDTFDKYQAFPDIGKVSKITSVYRKSTKKASLIPFPDDKIFITKTTEELEKHHEIIKRNNKRVFDYVLNFQDNDVYARKIFNDPQQEFLFDILKITIKDVLQSHAMTRQTEFILKNIYLYTSISRNTKLSNNIFEENKCMCFYNVIKLLFTDIYKDKINNYFDPFKVLTASARLMKITNEMINPKKSDNHKCIRIKDISNIINLFFGNKKICNQKNALKFKKNYNLMKNLFETFQCLSEYSHRLKKVRLSDITNICDLFESLSFGSSSIEINDKIYFDNSDLMLNTVFNNLERSHLQYRNNFSVSQLDKIDRSNNYVDDIISTAHMNEKINNEIDDQSDNIIFDKLENKMDDKLDNAIYRNIEYEINQRMDNKIKEKHHIQEKEPQNSYIKDKMKYQTDNNIENKIQKTFYNQILVSKNNHSNVVFNNQSNNSSHNQVSEFQKPIIHEKLSNQIENEINNAEKKLCIPTNNTTLKNTQNAFYHNMEEENNTFIYKNICTIYLWLLIKKITDSYMDFIKRKYYYSNLSEHIPNLNKKQNHEINNELTDLDIQIIDAHQKGFATIFDILEYKINYNKPKTTWAPSKIHGMGCFAEEDICEGFIIGEYTGEVISQKLSDLREKMYIRQNIKSTYLFSTSVNVIDATKYGCALRYCNHCCNPNAHAQSEFINNEHKIIIVASKSIKKGEEICLDYCITEGEKSECNCGDPDCKKLF
ncbi:hypothetical protein EDEG_03613 [Edhazardia aedis USNM 41457]|uniref:SET domain-containing protein n=1 Tax=Edhazardia aedis (strain USNM 41457) TaxID=1003232 RepID=J9DH39_EDHAE|nr:hypothetical protein EDEG_03613 [Edhazardia aedis USNM 41457]|eukprot:EJW01920.1 hypothetical protein EDEG_03613 [Edhazardia aedis USNM 41457]